MATQKKSRTVDPTELGVQIQEAAYYHWQARGGPHGSALEDWLYAEHLILDSRAEPKKESAVPEIALKSGAKNGSPVVVAQSKAAKAEEADAEEAPVKPKRKAVPKVKKSSAK